MYTLKIVKYFIQKKEKKISKKKKDAEFLTLFNRFSHYHLAPPQNF